MIVTTSIAFIIARDTEFDDVKTQKWLTSIVTGFFSSILLTEPTKVLSLAIFFACLAGKKKDDQEAGKRLQNEEQEDHSLFVYRPSVGFDRLNEAEAACGQNQRWQKIPMWSILRQSFIYLTFLVILFVVTYSNRDQNAFLHVQRLRKLFPNTRQIDHNYTKVATIHQYWSRFEESFAVDLHAQPWYNDASTRNLNGFITDKSNRRIGWAIMKQFRMKSVGRSSSKINQYCEEKRLFQPGWTNETTRIFNSSIDQSFRYRSDEELDTNGYVDEFRDPLSDLQNNLSKLN